MEQSVIKRLLAQSCRPARRSPETEELYGHYWAEERAFFERLSADAPALAQPYDALQRLYCDWAYEAGADRFAEGVRLGNPDRIGGKRGKRIETSGRRDPPADSSKRDDII